MTVGVTAPGRHRPSSNCISGAFCDPLATMLASAGNKNPHVFPDPVFAIATTSFPFSNIGHASA